MFPKWTSLQIIITYHYTYKYLGPTFILYNLSINFNFQAHVRDLTHRRIGAVHGRHL